MSEILNKVIQSVAQAEQAFFHFIVANEVGTTGSHQRGFYINKGIAPHLFDEKIEKSANYQRFVRIRWQDDFQTDSRLIYYGIGTRNEFRLTRFGQGFPYLKDEYIGSMIVFVRQSQTEYEAFVLDKEDDIDSFLLQFGLSPNDTNRFILAEHEDSLDSAIESVLGNMDSFPETKIMSLMARGAWNIANHKLNGLTNPDKVLLGWYNSEEILFKALENRVYKDLLTKPFLTSEAAANFANMMLNRRKSRAGKSLEHHLAAMFDLHQLKFEEQVKTEGNKRPDFIFPDGKAYHNLQFPTEKLVFLGAKTTCKDRWRQVLTEADRIKEKYLFTLQPGISSAQLNEMHDEHLHLVIPKSNISYFPAEHHGKLISLANFIDIVKTTQK